MNKEKSKTVKIDYHVTLSVPKAIHDRLKAVAKERGESQNALIRRVLKSYLDKKKAD